MSRRHDCQVGLTCPLERAHERRPTALLRRGGRSGSAGLRGGRRGSTYLLALSGFSPSSYYATQTAGGESGVSTGFFEAVLVRMDAATFSAVQMIAQRMNNSNQGHQLYVTGAGAVTASLADGGGVFRLAPTRTLAPSDVGKIHLIVLQHDGTFVRLWVDRVQAGTGTALTGFTASANAHALGAGFSLFASGIPILAALTARGVPSRAQTEAFYDDARRTGDLPRDFSLPMPILYGARIPGSGAAGNYLSTPGGVRGGHASGTWVGAWATISSLSGDEAFISTTANSAGGYVLFRQGNRLAVGRREAVAYNQVHTYTFLESDIGRRMLFGLSHDGTTLRGWCDGTEAGSLVCTPIMAPTAAPMSVATSWSGYPTQLIPAPNFTALGIVGGDGSVLTAGEWATLYADTVANGAIGTNAKATHRWDIAGAIAANGNAMPASVPDTIGTDHLTMTGSVVSAATGAVVTHRWSAREAIGTTYNPVGRKTYGVTGFTTANRLQTVGGPFTDPTLSLEMDLVFSTGLASGKHILSNATGSSVVGGFSVYQSANTLNVFSYGPGTNASFGIPAAYAGVRVTIKVEFTGTVCRAYLNGVSLGADVAATYVASTRPVYVGSFGDGSSPSDNVTIFRVRGGSLAQPILHDWDFNADITANGNEVPAQVLDRVGTDHLTRIGGLRVSNGGLTSFGASGYPQSATVASGLPGIAGAIWVEDLLVAPATPPAAIETVFSNTGISSNGLNLRMGTDGRITARYGDGSTFIDVVSPSALTAGDHHVATYYDGSVGHLFVDGVLVASSAAFAYQPGSQPTKIGTNYAGTSTPALTTVVKGASGGHVVPTIGEIAAASAYALANGRVGGIAGKTLRRYDVVQDIAEAGGKVPTHIKERVANVDHLWVLGQPLQPALSIATGPAAPASLPDTVTGAGIDTMSKVGVPSVASIDTTVDGRKSYGALGFSATNLLQTAAGIRGASAFTVGWFGIANALDGTNRTLVSARISSDGYRITHNSSSTAFWVYDGAAALLITSGAALPAGVPCGVVATWSAGVPKVYVCTPTGVVETTGTAGVAGYTPSAEPFRIGDSGAVGDEAINATWFGSTGMDGAAATLAQVQAWWASVRASGRIQAIGGAQHTWDAHADITANGGPENGIPATVQDRIGTDHLTRVGGPVVGAGNRVSGFASTVYGQSAGVAAPGAVGGFNAAVLYEHGTTITLEGLFACSNGGATNGFALALHSADRLFALIGNGTAASVLGDSPQTYLTVGRHHIALNYNGTQAKIFVDGVLKQTLTVAYAVSTSPASIGSMVSGANPARPHGVYGAAYGATSATDGEIATAAAASIAAGSIVGVPGKTDKRWSVVDDVIEAGGKVPAIIRERVSGVDHMVVTGATLQVAQRAERVWGYEASPILSGIATNGVAHHYVSTTGGAREVAGWGGTLVFVPRPTSTVVTRDIVNSLPGTLGWRVVTSATNSTIGMSFANGVGTHVAPASIAIAAFVNKLCCYTWQWTGTLLRVFLNRVETGSGTTIAGHMPSDGPIRLGWTSASDNEIFGLVLWDGVASAPQVQAQHDAIFANDGRVQPMPDAANALLVDPTRDALANGGVLGASIQDRIGAHHFTRVGSPVTAAQYARAFGV